MIRRIIALLAVAALALLGTIPAAHAGDTPTIAAGAAVNLDGTPFVAAAVQAYNCPSGHMCLYQHRNGGGAVYPIPQSWTGCRNLVGTYMDNQTSSIRNNTGYSWRVWQTYVTTCPVSGSTTSVVHPWSPGANMNAFWDEVITTYKRS